MMMLTAEIQKNYNKKTSEQKYYEISPNSLSFLLTGGRKEGCVTGQKYPPFLRQICKFAHNFLPSFAWI